MLSYLLRNIPADLWSSVKAAAKARGLSVRAYILVVLDEVTKKGA